MKDYELKKSRLSKKIKEEEAIIEQKQLELNSINEEIERQETIKEDLVNNIQNYEKCHLFLQSVVDKYSDEYSDIPDLLQRYKNLESSIEKLEKQNSDLEKELQDTKSENKRIEKETANEILLVSNEIANIQKKLEVKL